MLRFEQAYKVKANDNLGSASFWNERFQDLDVRLHAVEIQFGKFDVAAQQIIDAGIARINTTFQPLLDVLITRVGDLAIQVAELEVTVVTDQESLNAQIAAIIAAANTILAELESLGVFDGGTF